MDAQKLAEFSRAMMALGCSIMLLTILVPLLVLFAMMLFG